MNQNRPVPPAHVAIAMHAVTTHMVDRDLPVPASISSEFTCIEVFCYSEPVFDSWVQSLDRPWNHHGPITEQVAERPTSNTDLTAVTFTAPLPDTGVMIRLRTYRRIEGLPGKHRRLEAVAGVSA